MFTLWVFTFIHSLKKRVIQIHNAFDSSTATAPTSFEGNYGKIIYRVRAFVDTPRFAKDYKIEKPFYLLSLLNLNEVPDIWVRKPLMGILSLTEALCVTAC